MHFELADFNAATQYFQNIARSEWSELERIVRDLVPQLQASDQSSKLGSPIFDPKATNLKLTSSASALGWEKVPVPTELTAFGLDWDAGRSGVLAEWQFSNYPFLWNNIIRSEAVFKAPQYLPTGRDVGGLVIVTKGGSWPSSNSTLYFEQARAQIDIVTSLGVFDVPIRLVGLMIPTGVDELDADWNTYPGRYSRAAAETASHGRS